MQWLNKWDQARQFEQNEPAVVENPERPMSMIELYHFFKAKGEVEYFFANVCHDPAALIVG